jgi:hypothetical protein
MLECCGQCMRIDLEEIQGDYSSEGTTIKLIPLFWKFDSRLYVAA